MSKIRIALIALSLCLFSIVSNAVSADSMLIRLNKMQGEWRCIMRACMDPGVNKFQSTKESALVTDSAVTIGVLPCALTDSMQLERTATLWTFDYTIENVRLGFVDISGDTLRIYETAPHLIFRKFVRTDFDAPQFQQLKRGYYCMECLDGAWQADADSLQTCSAKMIASYGYSGITWISIPKEYYSYKVKKIRLPFGKRTRKYHTRLQVDFNRNMWVLVLRPVRGRFRKQEIIYTRSM